MRTTVHTVPGTIFDGEQLVRQDLQVRITNSDWGSTLSIWDGEQILLHIQLDHPSILKRLQEVLKK